MAREIILDGGEISLLKKIGLSGTQVYGKMLIDRIEGMETQEFLDTLIGLIDQGYVLSNKVNIRLIEDVGEGVLSGQRRLCERFARRGEPRPKAGPRTRPTPEAPLRNGGSVLENPAALAVAGGDLERVALRRMLRAL